MSRSFKKPVSNFMWRGCCVDNHRASAIWHRDTRKWLRRHNKHFMKMLNKSLDEDYLDFIVHNVRKVKQGDEWTSPQDGYYQDEFYDYTGWIK